jgi:NAD(P)-dependent dehydrogenase (short-subunit alcohol dehydrogenase family)
MSKVFGRLLAESGNGGSIVNISSIAGKMLSPTTAAYAASKAGLQALTACMSGEIARSGVRVNAICPGIIDTSRMDDLGRGELWQSFVDTRIPMGRAGVGEDIAYVVVYLCSDQGAWITGQSWNVDGGTVVQH